MLSIIAAVANKNVIGVKNDLPWNIPEDLKRFRVLTSGKTVLMGRNTYLSIVGRLGKPLPNRTNIVISNNPEDKFPEGVISYNNLDKALEDLKDKDVFVIGGAMIYKQLLPKADKLYITHIDKDYEGDAFFPEIDLSIWKKVWQEPHEGFSFVNYEKI